MLRIKQRFCYTIFDALPDDEFSFGESVEPYSFRREQLNKLAGRFQRYVSVLPVLYSGTDQAKIDELLEQMVREDKEGLMVNLDVPYKCKRHNGILKVKRFYTMDLPIIRCEEGGGRLANTLGAFVLLYKGNEVKVGSGFSDEQRSQFWDNRDGMIGQLCEVKYKEISSDKNTRAESLQFPVFVSLRTDKDEVSYG
jgi:DNA ligase-1